MKLNRVAPTLVLSAAVLAIGCRFNNWETSATTRPAAEPAMQHSAPPTTKPIARASTQPATQPAVAAHPEAAPAKNLTTVGTIERLSPDLNDLIAADAKIEVLADGFNWLEGPVWDRRAQCLYFSDIPANTVYRWKEGQGVSAYLKPAGYSGSDPRAGELGSNGLAINFNGRLILCQHGDRRIAKLERSGIITGLADRIDGRRFNSPNDLAISSNGDIYFTDPIYGLPRGADDPGRELPFCGVYRIAPNGQVTLMTRDISLPNGIALSPDEKFLYVAVSDPKRPVLMKYVLNADGRLGEGGIFFDATPFTATRKGMPDGLKVDVDGNIFLTGPGGVYVLTPQARHLGTILTGDLTSNCAWGDDGGTLYMTVNKRICRIRTQTHGAHFR